MTEVNLTDDQLTNLAVDLVLAMMRSVPQDTIRALDWWPRARAALASAANKAETVARMASEMSRKLQISAVTNDTANFLCSLDDELSDRATFKRFRHICRRDAVFLVAMAQAKRDEQRKTKKALRNELDELMKEKA